VSALTNPGAADFPRGESWGTKRPWSSGSLRGWAWADIPDELAERVRIWFEEGPTAELEPLKPPVVFRHGALVVKFYTRRDPLDLLRASRALRMAERHFRCLPVPSPRPLLAVGGRGARRSLLLREHVPGRLLSEVWRSEERARGELAPFLALMQRHRILHGDLHPKNLLWDGRGLWLLDVEGLRHCFHAAAPILEGQWARLIAHLGDEPGVERAYRESLVRTGRTPDASEWPRIRAEAERLALRLRAKTVSA